MSMLHHQHPAITIALPAAAQPYTVRPVVEVGVDDARSDMLNDGDPRDQRQAEAVRNLQGCKEGQGQQACRAARKDKGSRPAENEDRATSKLKW
jgi:hypothetical protein